MRGFQIQERAFMKWLIPLILFFSQQSYADHTCVFNTPLIQTEEVEKETYRVTITPQTTGICYTALIPQRGGLVMYPKDIQKIKMQDQVTGFEYESIIQGSYYVYAKGKGSFKLIDKKSNIRQAIFSFEVK